MSLSKVSRKDSFINALKIFFIIPDVLRKNAVRLDCDHETWKFYLKYRFNRLIRLNVNY